MPKTNLRRRHELIGVWLKQLRLKNELTQRDVAEGIGIHQRTFVAQVEAGSSKLPITAWIQAADLFKMDRNEFVTRLLDSYEPEITRVLHKSEWSYTNDEERKRPRFS